LPTVGLLLSLLQLDPLSLAGSMHSQSCGELSLQATRSSTTVPFSGSVKSCPEIVTGPCPAQLDLPLSLSYAGAGWMTGVLISFDASETATECKATNVHNNAFELRRYP
jgi:hypothetical protein